MVFNKIFNILNMILVHYQITLKLNENLNLLTPDLTLLKSIISDEANESIRKVKDSVIEAFKRDERK